MRSTIGYGWAALAIAIAALLSLIFYSYSAGFVSVSCDEFAKTLIASRGLSQPSEWFTHVWLPLHLGMIGVTSLVTGDLLVASRLISICFGVLLVVVMWGIGRQYGGVWAGALAAILGATHPLVVLLSATAMVDICYVATFMLGVRLYLRVCHSSTPSSIDLLAACGLFTLACAFHYNAWIVVPLMVPFLLRDLYRAHLPRPVVIAGLLLLGSVPCAWVSWNWAQTGEPLAFFSKHSDYSASFWAHFGWHPSPLAAIKAIYHLVRDYSPLLAILAFSGIGTLIGGRTTDRKPFLLWLLLLGFLAAQVVLYSRGGRPAAYEPRYLLLPSVLMILIASVALFRSALAGNREIRAFIMMLSLAALIVNIGMCRVAVDTTKHLDHYAYASEAQEVATYMHGLRSKNAPRMVLEIKAWNFLVLPVFLNRDDVIVSDRELIDDSVRHFENRSMLLGPREPVLAALKAKGVGFVAAWSPEVRANIEPWGLRPVGRVDSYTIYRVPGNPSRAEITSTQPLAPIGGATRR